MKMDTRRTLARLSVAALLAAPFAAAAAQSSGDGFMFHKPYGWLALRGGYDAQASSGQPYTIMKSQTNVGSRSFDAPSLGLDLAFTATRRFDVVFSLDGSSTLTRAEYRDWTDDQTGGPVAHTTTLERVGFGGSLRYNFVDRGRAISSLAFIPARYVPYVGIGGGRIWYHLKQSGDFVEETGPTTANIFTDELQSSSWGWMGQAFSGVDYRINARFSLLGEARYTHAKADLVADYTGLGRIDLSGLAFHIGTSFRF